MFKKIGEYLLGALIGSALFWSVVAGYQVMAGQGNLWSPTTGTVSGLALTNTYNAGLDALNTCNSGIGAPTNQLSGSPSKGNCWLDTSNAGFAIFKQYDGTQWLVTGIMDTTNHVYFQPAGGGNLSTISVNAASTTDLCGSVALQGGFLLINGTTTINSFGSTCPAGSIKTVYFSNVLTLTASVTLNTNGGVNISTNSGDVMTFVTDGVGNWYQIGYNSRVSSVSCPSGVTAASVVVKAGQVQHC